MGHVGQERRGEAWAGEGDWGLIRIKMAGKSVHLHDAVQSGKVKNVGHSEWSHRDYQ